MKHHHLAALILTGCLVGCGGSGISPALQTGNGATSTSPAVQQGAYAGTWSSAAGGPSSGAATVTVDSSLMVTFSLQDASNTQLTLNGGGRAGPDGTFTGTMSNSLRTWPINGLIKPTLTGISLTVTFELTPGAVGAPMGTYYVTASKVSSSPVAAQ